MIGKCDPFTILGGLVLASVLVVFVGALFYAWAHDRHVNESRILRTRIRVSIDGLVFADDRIDSVLHEVAFAAGDGGTWFDETIIGSPRVVIRLIAPDEAPR